MPSAAIATATAPDEVECGAAWTDLVRDVGREIFGRFERLTLAEWSERYRRWPDGSPYRIDETPHVREVLDAYCDPSIEEITIMKPSQSGLTEGFVVNAIGYHVHQDPRAILLTVPSVDEAKKWSRKKLDPMIDSTPVVQGKLEEASRSSSSTMQEKGFPGGSLGIVGSNSGRGFRMVTIGTAIGDDVEGWDATAGKGQDSEGDQVTLIRRRTDRVPDRKMAWVSTPKFEGGRIHHLYESMERRGEWHVPCPHCGTMQVLRLGGPDTKHGLRWEKEKVTKDYQPKPGEVLRGTTVHRPDTAWYQCEANGCRIEESSKSEMEAAGEYLADDGLRVRQPGIRSIGLWLHGTLSLTLPGSEWPRVIREFLDVKDYRDKLQGFTNLVLAEPWRESGDAPKWRRLYGRREDFERGTCPEGVEFVTVGVDVQDDWIEAHTWGWGYERESWFIDHVVSEGSPEKAGTWDPITAVLHRTYPGASGREFPVAGLAVDTGHKQSAVVAWAYRVADRRIMLVKGNHWQNWTSKLGTPSKSEVTISGKKTGLMLWPVGGALIKQEFYGFLGLEPPLDGEPFPAGWVHVPAWVDDRWVKGVVGEELQVGTDKGGFMTREWVKIYARNEPLDGRVYAQAVAEREGLARLTRRVAESKSPPSRPAPEEGGEGRGGWLGRGGRRGGGGSRRRGGWLR